MAVQAHVDAKLPGRVNQLSCRRCMEADRAVFGFCVAASACRAWPLVRVARQRTEMDRDRPCSPGLRRTWGRQRGVPSHQGARRPRPAGLADHTARPSRGGRADLQVALVHGGPWVRRGTLGDWSADEQFLASRGYVVINAEFRGSRGYGYTHFQAGWRQWGRAMQDDVADAVEWAIREGWADARRVCIAGASYGGYAVLMGLIRDPELYRCGAAWVAVTDPRLMFQPVWRSDMSDETRHFSLPTLIGDPEKDADMLSSASPVAQAERLRSPLLLAFGQEDLRVPIEHANRMRDALREQGRVPEFVVYEGEGHSWLKVQTRVDFAQRLERFLAQHLGPVPKGEVRATPGCAYSSRGVGVSLSVGTVFAHRGVSLPPTSPPRSRGGLDGRADDADLTSLMGIGGLACTAGLVISCRAQEGRGPPGSWRVTAVARTGRRGASDRRPPDVRAARAVQR